MDKEQWVLLNGTYNELVRRAVQAGQMDEPDRYEREDAFMGAMLQIDDGCDVYEVFKDSFCIVHDVALNKMQFDSAYQLCQGWSKTKM